MADNQRRLILGNGEQYIQPIKKTLTGRSPEPPRTYDEARDRIKSGIGSALQAVEQLPEAKKFSEEVVFCMRLHPDVTAKSYDPAAIFKEAPDLWSVGSRNYRTPITEVAQTKRIEKRQEEREDEKYVKGRLVFVQGSSEGFQKFLNRLDQAGSKIPAKFQEEIRRIERFDTLDVKEQLLGFGEKARGACRIGPAPKPND